MVHFDQAMVWKVVQIEGLEIQATTRFLFEMYQKVRS